MFLPEAKFVMINGKMDVKLYKAYYKCKDCGEITHNYGNTFKCDECGAKYLITNELVNKMEEK